MMLRMPQDAGVLELRTVERYKEGDGNMEVEVGAGLRIGVKHCSRGVRKVVGQTCIQKLE